MYQVEQYDRLGLPKRCYAQKSRNWILDLTTTNLLLTLGKSFNIFETWFNSYVREEG